MKLEALYFLDQGLRPLKSFRYTANKNLHPTHLPLSISVHHLDHRLEGPPQRNNPGSSPGFLHSKDLVRSSRMREHQLPLEHRGRTAHHSHGVDAAGVAAFVQVL